MNHNNNCALSIMVVLLLLLLLQSNIVVVVGQFMGEFKNVNPNERTGPRMDMPIPRITIDELYEYPKYWRGEVPFILTNVATKWKAMKWTLDDLVNQFPEKIVDYFPKNLRSNN